MNKFCWWWWKGERTFFMGGLRLSGFGRMSMLSKDNMYCFNENVHGCSCFYNFSVQLVVLYHFPFRRKMQEERKLFLCIYVFRRADMFFVLNINMYKKCESISYPHWLLHNYILHELSIEWSAWPAWAHISRCSSYYVLWNFIYFKNLA